MTKRRENPKCPERKEAVRWKSTRVNKRHSRSVSRKREYEVEQILKRRMVGNRSEYLLHWKGFRKNESTWEPLENLNCPDLLKDFEERQVGEESVCCTSISKESGLRDESTKSPFDNLPVEMKFEIFKLLPPADKKNCRLVCSEWRNVMDTSFVAFRATLNDGTVGNVQNFRGRFDEIRVQELRQSHAWSIPLANSKKLTFENTQGASCVIRDNMVGVLKSNRAIRTLVFKRGSIDETCACPLPPIRFEFLTHLEIRLKNRIFGPDDLPSFDLFANLEAPRVTTLCVVVDENLDDFHYIYAGLYSLVAKFSRSVRYLKVALTRAYQYAPKPHIISSRAMERIRLELISNLRLDSLRLVIDKYEGRDGRSLAFDILSSQKSLQCLGLKLNLGDVKVEEIVSQAIENNSTTLRKLSVHRCVCGLVPEMLTPHTDVLSLMLKGIENCSKLEILEIFSVGQDVTSFRTPLPPSVQNLTLKANVCASALYDLVRCSPCPRLQSLCLIDTTMTTIEEGILRAIHFVLQSYRTISKIQFQNTWINPIVAFQNFPNVAVSQGLYQNKAWHYGLPNRFHH